MKTLPNATFDEKLPAVSSPNVNQRKQILVADDDEGIRQFIYSALTQSGYEVDEAENGVRAWKALHLKNYDLLITDNNMPQMTGLQLIQKLRTAGFELPVALASGSLSPDLFAKNTWLRAAVAVPKPFILDELIQTVKVLLAGACQVSTPNLDAGRLPVSQQNSLTQV